MSGAISHKQTTVISVNTMTSSLRNKISFPLLVVFLLSHYHNTCVGVPIENVETSTSDNVLRPEVRITDGAILGVNMVTHRNRRFFGFKGIPFAQPPVGNLRFKGPLPANPWNGTIDGSRDSNQCPQVESNVIVGNEDCLYLNVYTPRLPANGNFTMLPVMMFVYGGGFKTGTNNPRRWGPQFLLNKDVVIVVASYRVGLLGFLSTGDEVSPGNYGLKDIVLALEWIQRNIPYFGGDPKQVTLFGGSSGSSSVHFLALSNLTNGLFHRYITQSGPAISPIAPIPRSLSVNHTLQLATHLGCPTDTSTSLVNCLRGFEPSQLVDTYSLFYVWYMLPQLIWGPTIEPEIEGALITDTPKNLLAAGKIRDLPWISHVTRDEGIVWAALFYEKPDLFQEFLDDFDSMLPIILQYDQVDANTTAFTAALKANYFNDLSVNRDLLMKNLTQLLGDLMVLYPSYRGIKQQLVHAKNPVYLCTFDYRGTVSYSYFFTGGSTKNWGVAHGDELLYLLPGPNAQFGPPGWEFNENDWAMVDTMVQLWTSFAINGTPTALSLNDTVVWEPFSQREAYLQIGNGLDTALEVKYGFLPERMQFWKELNAATTWL